MKSIIGSIAAVLLASTVSACSSSGDTKALLIETAQACSVACANHPDIDSFSYEAGGGLPLLFIGKIAASCACSDVDGQSGNQAFYNSSFK